jgi:hypothetical protein
MKGKSRDMIMFSILSTDLKLWFLLVCTILNFHQRANTLVHQMVPWKGEILAFGVQAQSGNTIFIILIKSSISITTFLSNWNLSLMPFQLLFYKIVQYY